MWSVTHVIRKDIISTSAPTDSQERLSALVIMGSLGAHTTKQKRTVPRSAGMHPHLKDQAGGKKNNRGKQQSNARRAEAADSGGSSTPIGAHLQEMFATFMLTQNAASAGPRREDSYSGSVVELRCR
jgi:hypothetical protein